MDFDSLNPYQSIVAISGDSPDDLIAALKRITTPIKIISIVAFGTKQVAYVTGDVRIKKLRKPKEKINGSGIQG